MKKVEPYGLTMPPWTPRPLTIEPIACSRMPKAMLRPDCVREKSPPPTNSVFVDSTRAAAPPSYDGTALLNACMTAFPASRVASDSPASHVGGVHAPMRPLHAC